MKATRLSLLGATGSIGENVLDIVRRFPERFSLTALAGHTRVERLAAHIREFRPAVAVVKDADHAGRLAALLRSGQPEIRTDILWGDDGYRTAATLTDTDMVVGAMTGAAGLAPTLAAIDAGKTIALANKETLVMAGSLVMDRAARRGVPILPIDSEHSAIFQCLQGQRRDALSKIILTASGGPFRDLPADHFATITPERALKHPNWSMGPKITIDSATLMNKGLEIIEARWLFDVPRSGIEVVVHPQSIIHSMVAFRDGSVLAQLGVPDMRQAIAYALSYPERLPIGQPLPDFPALASLTFHAPDTGKFPCLALAFHACDTGGSLPAVLNAANEVAVAAFLEGRVPFPGIPALVEEAMNRHSIIASPSLDDLLAADADARRFVHERVNPSGEMAARHSPQ